jgi:decaprenyl-phosphate phosphoribosyltransferase
MSESSTRTPRGRESLPPRGARFAGVGSPLVRAMRPRQWLKNVLVAAAPLAAGSLFVRSTFEHVTVTFACFCLVSSAGYLVNDVLDVENDRAHPTKRTRPVASGALPARTALFAAAALGVVALGIGASLVSLTLGLVLLVYLALTISYSLGIKRQAVFDLAVVSAAFVVRAIAGGVAARVSLSEWFLLVASFGSLFMVAGKRYADVLQMPARREESWSVVPYSASYLRFVWGLAATSATIGYALWAFDVGSARGHSSLWAELSVAPFVLGILRYAADVDRGQAGSPEDVVLQDRGLQLIVIVWLVSFGIAAHVV